MIPYYIIREYMFVSTMRVIIVEVSKPVSYSDLLKHLVIQGHITKKYILLRKNFVFFVKVVHVYNYISCWIIFSNHLLLVTKHSKFSSTDILSLIAS
jgi:hypothetical protein